MLAAVKLFGSLQAATERVHRLHGIVLSVKLTEFQRPFRGFVRKGDVGDEVVLRINPRNTLRLELAARAFSNSASERLDPGSKSSGEISTRASALGAWAETRSDPSSQTTAAIRHTIGASRIMVRSRQGTLGTSRTIEIGRLYRAAIDSPSRRIDNRLNLTPPRRRNLSRQDPADEVSFRDVR